MPLISSANFGGFFRELEDERFVVKPATEPLDRAAFNAALRGAVQDGDHRLPRRELSFEWIGGRGVRGDVFVPRRGAVVFPHRLSVRVL
jgi:hypothetical protein